MCFDYMTVNFFKFNNEKLNFAQYSVFVRFTVSHESLKEHEF